MATIHTSEAGTTITASRAARFGFSVNGGSVVHRVREVHVTFHRKPEIWRNRGTHLTVLWCCGNQSNGAHLTDTPPEGVALCETCESKKHLAGQPVNPRKRTT